MTARDCPEHGNTGHGDVAEELRLLVLALLDRFEPGVRSVLAGLRVEAAEAAAAGSTDDATAANGATADGHAASDAGAGGSEARLVACQWCPVCSLIALLRGDRPELAGRLAEHAGGLLSTLREATDRPAPEPTESSAPTAPRVQRIEVTRVGGGC